MENQTLLKQMDAITKNQNIALPADDARQFMSDMVSRASTLPKLGKHFAKSDVGQIDALNIAPRQTKLHQGLATAVDIADKVTSRAVEFVVRNLYLDLWLERDTIYYTAQSRGQDIDQAVAQMLQQRFAADVQDLAFNGDEAGTGFIAMNDGFLKLAAAAATGARNVEGEVTMAKLAELVGSIPADQIAVGDYKFILGRASYLKLQAEVANRTSAAGDAALINGTLTAAHGFGFEVVDHITSSEVIFTPLENLVTVLGRQVGLNRVAEGVEPTIKQAIMYFLLSGVDFVIRTPQAVAYLGPVTP
ncbi:phage major capsid protein [Exiguobacterium sp. s21]|uniref:phage major capsid family protein n=1 Tax=Exiguobacterium sp. s21 TaxID=2751244 RepID=UPI001BEC7EB9|nr:phage major capsid protein [Exiguobacterium sp. s21]